MKITTTIILGIISISELIITPNHTMGYSLTLWVLYGIYSLIKKYSWED